MKFILSENQFKNKLMGKKDLVETLKFENNYSDFMDFYDNCEEPIYRKIMEIYDKLKQENEEEENLIVIATINGFIFDTNIEIKKTDTKLLNEFIKPFFEKMEDYETCNKITKMCTD